MLAELELAARVDMATSGRIEVAFDLLGRLLSIGLPVVPEHLELFTRAAEKFAEELPLECVARRALQHLFRSEDDGRANGMGLYRLYWNARWYGLGCPAVTLERNLAASLMATDTAEELIDAVRPPWDCFIVRLPGDLVEQGGIPFTHLVVHRHIQTFETAPPFEVEESWRNAVERYQAYLQKVSGTMWGFFGMSGEGLRLARIDKLAVMLGKEQGEYLVDGTLETAFTPEDRLIEALARLVVGICHLSESPNAMRRKSTKKKHHHRWRFSKLPLTTEYVLAPDVPIKFDCTEGIGAYLRGDRKALPRIQYIVRGHWRNQAHGPGRTERKRIWIQPYWKGPEDMPRLFREHRFESTSDHSDSDP